MKTEHGHPIPNLDTILIVDDEASVRKTLGALFRSKGYRVSLAGTVQEARTRLTQEEPALLITDIHMPDGSGLELARHLKKSRPEVPFVVMTGQGEMQTAIDAVRLSAADYLLKPFKRGELTALVRKILEKRALEEEREDRIRSMERQIQSRTDAARGLRFGNVYSLVEALEAKDPYTRGHSARVTRYALCIAEGMGSELDPEILRLGATLHDIGKIGVRGTTLNKDGPLDDEEWEQVRDHTVIGERIVMPVTDESGILGAIRSHHERWDGGGYPDGLAGEAIPTTARIVAVADCLDAITSSRAYRGARSREEALLEVRRQSGVQFDPRVAHAALEVMGRWWWPGQERLYRGAASTN